MKSKAMQQIAHAGLHDCCPKAWRDVPKLTGDYDADATIMHRENKDLPDRLAMYTKRPRPAYGIRSGYGSYGEND